MRIFACFLRHFGSVLCCIVLCLLFMYTPVEAAGQTLLQNFIQNTKAAQGTFRQDVLTQSGQIKERSNGTFAFVRPGKFRWDIQNPYPQLMVANGKILTVYDADLQQATERPLLSGGADALGATPAALLFGQAKIESLFAVQDDGAEAGLRWVKAIPKNKEALFDWIRIGFKDQQPMQIWVKDSLGQTTRIVFEAWQNQASLSASLFEFSPPQGVEMIRVQP